MRIPASGSLARRRLSWTSIAFEPERLRLVRPGVLGDRLAVHDGRRAAHQQLEDPVLGRGQAELPAVDA